MSQMLFYVHSCCIIYIICFKVDLHDGTVNTFELGTNCPAEEDSYGSLQWTRFIQKTAQQGRLTLRGILSSQSGKLITFAALPTHSTTTVANICTQTHVQWKRVWGSACFQWGVCWCTRGRNVQLTCPIPTHIEEGNLQTVRAPLVPVNLTGWAQCKPAVHGAISLLTCS